MSGGGGGGKNSQTVNINSQDQRTDSGWISASTIAQACLVAIAGINTVAAMKMNDKQMEIAKGYLDIARELHDYFMNVFRPCETAAVLEACSEPKYEPMYDWRAGRFIVNTRNQFAGAMDQLACLGRYCTGLTASMAKDLALAEAIAVGDSANFAYRYEENRKEAKDTIRWDRRIQALGLGRNLMKESLAYARAAEGAFGDLGQQAGAAAGSALGALGYFVNRKPTDIPQNAGYNASEQDAGYPPAPSPRNNVPIPTPKPQQNVPTPIAKPQVIMGQNLSNPPQGVDGSRFTGDVGSKQFAQTFSGHGTNDHGAAQA